MTNIRFPKSCRFRSCAAQEKFQERPRHGSEEFAAEVVGKSKLKNLMCMISVWYGGTSSRFIPTNILYSSASLVIFAPPTHIPPILLSHLDIEGKADDLLYRRKGKARKHVPPDNQLAAISNTNGAFAT
jgi:hypothetical protein